MTDNLSMTLAEWIENIQKKGRLTFTKDEAMKSLNLKDKSFRMSVLRLSKKRRVVKLANGFYSAIPISYQTGKGLPPTLYIDQLMKYHKQPYYVALLSAATFHGSTHQAVQELQVMTTKPMHILKIDNVTIRFFSKSDFTKTATQKMNVQTGQIVISTPESTAIDLMQYLNKSGGLNHVATVLLEMRESLKPKELLKGCKAVQDLSASQRLGYILKDLGEKDCSRNIQNWLKTMPLKFVKLDPNGPFKGAKKNNQWKIIENVELEPDEV